MDDFDLRALAHIGKDFRPLEDQLSSRQHENYLKHKNNWRRVVLVNFISL